MIIHPHHTIRFPEDLSYIHFIFIFFDHMPVGAASFVFAYFWDVNTLTTLLPTLIIIVGITVVVGVMQQIFLWKVVFTELDSEDKISPAYEIHEQATAYWRIVRPILQSSALPKFLIEHFTNPNNSYFTGSFLIMLNPDQSGRLLAWWVHPMWRASIKVGGVIGQPKKFGEYGPSEFMPPDKDYLHTYRELKPIHLSELEDLKAVGAKLYKELSHRPITHSQVPIYCHYPVSPMFGTLHMHIGDGGSNDPTRCVQLDDIISRLQCTNKSANSSDYAVCFPIKYSVGGKHLGIEARSLIRHFSFGLGLFSIVKFWKIRRLTNGKQII